MRHENDKKTYELPLARLFMIPTDDIVSCSFKKNNKKNDDSDSDISMGEWDPQD